LEARTSLAAEMDGRSIAGARYRTLCSGSADEAIASRADSSGYAKFSRPLRRRFSNL
jgi:hypothetical protein